MGELSILRLRTRVDELSAESRFLDAMLAEQAARAFAGVDWHTSPEGLSREPGHVLVVAGNLLICERSLRAMRELGAPKVVPRQVLPEPKQPIYTLSDYERVEGRWLDRPASQIPDQEVVWLQQRAGFRWDRPIASSASAGVYLQMSDYYGSAREDILPFVPPGTKTVLEVGCGKGATAALLRERLGCRVTGVELNAEVCRVARARMHRVIHGDFLEVPLRGRYDLLLATDVFEHILSGVAFLRKASRLARRILLSVPNVGHYSVVGALLEGRWDYVPAGLLCYTHMRFFTRHSLVNLLRQTGFERFSIHLDRGEIPDWVNHLPVGLAVDRESLATRGFYVLIETDS